MDGARCPGGVGGANKSLLFVKRGCIRNRGRLPLVEDLSATVRRSLEPFGSQGMTLSITWIPHYFWSRNLGFNYR